MGKQKLLALLVGIDKYAGGISPLRGCVNDKNAFRDYLVRQSQRDKFDLVLHELENQNATRAAVVDGFNHFAQAADGDVCVLYMSGHGSRIPGPQFWESSDGMNETYLCADSTLDDGGADLIDKELSWLIHRAVGGKNVHFLAVMDCCHSGTNTRDGNMATVGVRQVQHRNMPRPIEHYLGYRDYAVNADGQYSAPKAQHISFGACRSYQTAKEIALGNEVHGAFTTSLLQALEPTNTTLSYADLEARVAQKIANRTFDQLPQLDAVAGANTNTAFLGGAIAAQRRFSIGWNDKKMQWELDAGVLHGIAGGPDGTVVTVKGRQEPLRLLDVLADRSVLATTIDLDKTQQYEATVQQAGASARQVAFAPGSDAAGIALLEKALADTPRQFVALNPDNEQAECWAHARNGKFALTMAGSDRPLFNPVEAQQGVLAADGFWQKTNAVFQWQHLLDLENSQTTIREDEFELELWHSEGKNWTQFNEDNYQRVADWRNPPPFCWSQSSECAPGYALRIKNTGQRDLHVSALHLSGRYGISNEFLPGRKIAPGESAWMTQTSDGIEYKVIGLDIDEEHWLRGFTDMTDYVKILVSTAEFNTGRFNQEELTLTLTAFRAAMKIGGGSQKVNVLDWTTRRIPLRIIKPQKTQSLAGGATASFNQLKITAPAGFSANTALAGAAEASRGLTAQPDPINQEGIRPLALTPDFARSPGHSVMELSNVSGQSAVTPDTPISIQLDATVGLESDEMVMPFGFDPETKAWIPLGLPGGSDTPVKIGSLPPSTPSGDRAIGESLLLFFHKISVGKPVVGAIAAALVGKLEPYRLVAVQVNNDESIGSTISDTAELHARVQQAKRILLCTHGITGDTRDSVKMVVRLRDPQTPERRLRDCYDLVLTFDYENLGTDIDEIARILGKKLEAIGLTPGHGKTLHIVAHSMGGLVTRWFIEREGGNRVVSALVQAGTPNGGTQLYKAYDMLQILITKAVNFLPVSGMVKNIIGWLAPKTGVQDIDNTFLMMKPGSKFLTMLAASPDPGIPYYVVAGNTQMIEQEAKVLGKVLSRLGYGSFDMLFGGANDIAVGTDAIQQIPPGRNPQAQTGTAACNHMAYFSSPAGLEALGNVFWKLQ